EKRCGEVYSGAENAAYSVDNPLSRKGQLPQPLASVAVGTRLRSKVVPTRKLAWRIERHPQLHLLAIAPHDDGHLVAGLVLAQRPVEVFQVANLVLAQPNDDIARGQSRLGRGTS